MKIDIKYLEEFIAILKNRTDIMSKDYKEGYLSALESINNYLIGCKEGENYD